MAEGLFDPRVFPFPASFDAERVLAALVRLVPRTIVHLDLFDDEEARRAFSGNALDADGAEVWRRGFLRADVDRCAAPPFSCRMAQHVLCRAIAEGRPFPALVPLEGGATGALVGGSRVLTNRHCVASWLPCDTVPHLRVERSTSGEPLG